LTGSWTVAGRVSALSRNQDPSPTSALRHSGEAHALTDALFGSEEGGIVTHRIGEEAAASEVGIEKSNSYALQCGWVEAYDCASRPAFDRLQPVLGRASDAG